jgi:hypothetical protein
MRQRTDLIEIFSAFLQFEDDRSQGWAIDPRLNRSMTRSIPLESRGGEDFWAAYWLKQYAQQTTVTNPDLRLAIGHLAAYLQETCFWAVNRVMPRVGSIQMKLSDCFQAAITDVPKLLAAFDASQIRCLVIVCGIVCDNGGRLIFVVSGDCYRKSVANAC